MYNHTPSLPRRFILTRTGGSTLVVFANTAAAATVRLKVMAHHLGPSYKYHWYDNRQTLILTHKSTGKFARMFTITEVKAVS